MPCNYFASNGKSPIIGQTFPETTAMNRKAFLSLALLLSTAGGPVLIAGPASAQLVAPPPECAVLAGSPMIEAELFFGRNIGDGLGVTDRAWAQFVDQEITPRFPDGLTIQDASGHWRDSVTGRLIREPSKVVILLTERNTTKLALIREIAEAYKRRFQQQAVGTVLRPSCVSF